MQCYTNTSTRMRLSHHRLQPLNWEEQDDKEMIDRNIWQLLQIYDGIFKK